MDYEYFRVEESEQFSFFRIPKALFTEKEFEGLEQYGTFKKIVADKVVSVIQPFQEKYKEILKSGIIDQVLAEGAKRANYIANKTLRKVKKTVGLYVHD